MVDHEFRACEKIAEEMLDRAQSEGGDFEKVKLRNLDEFKQLDECL